MYIKSAKRLMLWPSVFLLLIITIFPFLFTIILSFSKVSLVRGISLSWNGIYNWSKLMKDGRFWYSIMHTYMMVILATLIEYILGFGLALILYEKLKYKNFFQTLFLIPMAITPVAVGYAWRMLFDQTKGPIDNLLMGLSLSPIKWLTSSKIAIFSVIIVDIWEWTPFIFLIMLVALKSLPKNIMEAAIVDGATKKVLIYKIIFPILLPNSLAAIFLRMIEAFKIIDIIIIMTGGGPGISTESTTLYAYTIGLGTFDLAYGATIAMAFFIMILITILLLIFLINWVFGKKFKFITSLE